MLRDMFSRWWRKRFHARGVLAEPEGSSAEKEVRDPDPPASDPDTRTNAEPAVGADLLQLRMQTLHIDTNDFTDPFTINELQITCKMCKSRGACALELAHASADSAWGEWREYCPNAVKLNELRVRSAMRSHQPFLK